LAHLTVVSVSQNPIEMTAGGQTVIWNILKHTVSWSVNQSAQQCATYFQYTY